MNIKSTSCKALALLSLLFLAGCASNKYTAVKYQPAQDRFGSIDIKTQKKVYLCPTIDRLDSKCRKFLSSEFTPWRHTTDAFEAELKTSGIVPARPAFEFGPSFDSLKTVIAEKAPKSENAIYLGTELLWLTAAQFTVDAVAIAPSGEVLFEKRGICVSFGGKSDPQGVTHMAIRQILADPKFKEVL